MIDPGKDYTSPECDRRSGEERRVDHPTTMYYNGKLKYFVEGEQKPWHDCRRTTTDRRER